MVKVDLVPWYWTSLVKRNTMALLSSGLWSSLYHFIKPRNKDCPCLNWQPEWEVTVLSIHPRFEPILDAVRNSSRGIVWLSLGLWCWRKLMQLIFPPDEVSERCPKRQEVITASRGLRDGSINCLRSRGTSKSGVWLTAERHVELHDKLVKKLTDML